MAETYFVARLPRRTVVGDPTIMPTSFQEHKDAWLHARKHATARQNVSVRIDDMLYVLVYYVVIKAESEKAALREAMTNPRFREMRDKGNPIPVQDEY